jgi:hypothetical protein
MVPDSQSTAWPCFGRPLGFQSSVEHTGRVEVFVAWVCAAYGTAGAGVQQGRSRDPGGAAQKADGASSEGGGGGAAPSKGCSVQGMAEAHASLEAQAATVRRRRPPSQACLLCALSQPEFSRQQHPV